MTYFKKLFNSALIVVLLVGAFGNSACGGVSDEEMAQLEALRSEVGALESEINQLKSEKTKLEREIAEQNAKLEQCARDKAETQKNLKK
jgi:septal ring factor EnvC (AmiA/AmiB activator)